MYQAINPTNGSIVREIPYEDDAGVEARLSRAADAFRAWRDVPMEDRAELFERLAKVLRREVGDLAPLMTEEMGKPIREARGEIEKCAVCCDHYAGNAALYLAPDPLNSDAVRSWVQYVPLGTVLGILPWNSPFWLSFRVCVPAAIAGNVVLLKPDSHVPACGAALPGLFERAGFPAGVVDVLFADTDQIARVLRDDRVHAVSLTGSTRAGAAVAQVAGEVIKPAVLELGGSDPAIVLADADLDKAVEALAFSKLICAGQSCIAPKRMIVAESVYDEFLEKFRARLAAVRVGDPSEESTDVGPIARADLRDEIHRQVSETVSQGARCLLGGEIPDGPGSFYPVTLLADVTSEMTAFREEVFGPVAAVAKVGDADEAIALANRTEYGLAASIWTHADRGVAMARRIEAGQVVINGVVKTDPRLPSGGIKRSGYGRELGPHGIREFVNVQQVWEGPA